MRNLLTAAAVMASISLGAFIDPRSDKHAHGKVESDLVLIREALDAEREIRIVKGRSQAVASLNGLVDARLMEQATATYPVRIEVHRAAGDTLVLASRLRVEAKPPARGIAALDVISEPGQIVVAMIEGPDLALWSVPIGWGTPAWSVLPPWEWSVAGPLEVLDPRQVDVKLVRSDRGRIRAEVKDSRRTDSVVYEQVEDQWIVVGVIPWGAGRGLRASPAGLRQQDEREDMEVFRRPVAENREVVVVRGPRLDPTILAGIAHPRMRHDVEALHEVRIEIRSAGGGVAKLWSHLKPDAYDVLDLVFEAGRITMASAEGGDLFITHIGVGYGTMESVSLRGADWSAIAAPLPFDRRQVEVTLGRLEGGRAIVNVVDHRGETTPQRTVFEQAGDRWAFDLVERSGGPPGTPQLER